MTRRFALAPTTALAVALLAAGCSGGSSTSVRPAVDRAPQAGSASAPAGAAGAARASAAANAASDDTLTTERLGSYRIDPSKVFVAGISSGGFFAVQMHFAHSAVFKGAAIYAGGVDHCANDSVELALANCGGQTLPNGQASYSSTLAQSEQYIDSQSAAGTIGHIANISGQPVYLWSGTNDSVVNPQEVADLASEYAHYGARVRFDNTFPAEHGWESPDGQLGCGTKGSPFMISCARTTQPYDSVKKWMTSFFGPLQPRAAGALQGTLHRFDQSEFGAAASNSLDSRGFAFVPASCAGGATCGLVLALHGCLQTRALIGRTFVTESGIDEWADGNRVVVLYPYAVAAPGPTPYNPNGCWDWWGYDDPNYALRSGTQISIVYHMVQRVMGQR